MFTTSHPSRVCEFGRKPRLLALLAPLALTLVCAVGSARAQEPAHEPAAEAHEQAHEESIWPFVGKLFNFVVLAGGLFYLARTPLSNYLARRRSEVRADLDAAESMKTAAAKQMAEIDTRMKALPGELEALGARGRNEIAAEEQRIREIAEAERQRLLAQATREIDQKIRVARRELVEHAADLTIGVASAKIRDEITDADRTRLVDRYLAQVTSHE